MNILAIETSCDETAVSIIRAEGVFPHATYTILGNALLSQIDIHREYGGVFPAVAKREHARTLVPLLAHALKDAHLPAHPHTLTHAARARVSDILSREYELAEALSDFLASSGRPQLDAIAVTAGPGLAPALWVGVNCARALADAWQMPLVPINHMEGHVFVSLFDGTALQPMTFPGLALLISGGHTELDLITDWHAYRTIGQTRDDAAGEAFDKVARMLELPYPGGPEIAQLAERARSESIAPSFTLPRPMLESNDLDFSFSGLKTAVLYLLKDRPLTDTLKKEVARAFEDAATDVLIEKTRRAIDAHAVQTLILGGGVAANTHIRNAFTELFSREYPERALYLPERTLTTDNALMIALAAHARIANRAIPDAPDIVANSNWAIGSAY